jgi:ribosomal protein S18 acetylase RimI-like enzyme
VNGTAKLEFGGVYMKIRNMVISDYKDVYNLWMSCEGMGLNNLDDSKEGIEKFLNRNPETCFVAEIENKVVGVIITGNDGRRGYIYHTAVDPRFRKQGIAHSLVETTLNALKQCGINKVALVVFKRNQNGNDFWEKLNFTTRNDLIYRNKAITKMIRIDT